MPDGPATPRRRGPPARRRPLLGIAGAATLHLLAGCAEHGHAELADRSSRFGIFRDLVLVHRSDHLGGPFFVDRFETTQADWRAYVRALGGSGGSGAVTTPPQFHGAEDALPVTRLSLADARRYAAWRFGRLPRIDEWKYLATGSGRYLLPWGDPVRATWANTAELGVGRLTPVGAFESGRQSGGPYDIVGNAGEWTESIPAVWLPGEDLPPPSPRGRHLVPVGPTRAAIDRPWHPARWLEPALPLPTITLLLAHAHPLADGGDDVPRLVCGRVFTPMRPGARSGSTFGDDPQVESQSPAGGTPWTGVRVYASPRELLDSLLAVRSRPPDADLEPLVVFLREDEHREVLAAELRAGELAGSTSALAGLLAAELGS